MVQPLTAEKLVEQVEQRIQDEGQLIFGPQKILDAADLAFQHIWDSVRFGDSTADLDRMDVAPASWTRVEDLWYEYELPEYVGSIRRVEGPVGGAGDVRPIEAIPVGVDTKDYSRLPFRSNTPGWFRSRFGHPGKIAFMGDVFSFSSVRIWFQRRYPPLHYGVAGNGTGSTTLLTFDTTPTAGTLIKRADLYVGMDVQFTGATNTDVIRRITAWTGTVATLASPTPVNITSTQAYSLIVPLEVEHGEYFIETVVRRLLARLGNTEHMAATEPQYSELRERFRASAHTRDGGKPLRIQRRWR